VPVVRQMPGFRGYYLIDGDPDVLITISMFDSVDEAIESNITNCRIVNHIDSNWCYGRHGHRAESQALNQRIAASILGGVDAIIDCLDTGTSAPHFVQKPAPPASLRDTPVGLLRRGAQQRGERIDIPNHTQCPMPWPQFKRDGET
jgi:hypothetical protein